MSKNKRTKYGLIASGIVVVVTLVVGLSVGLTTRDSTDLEPELVPTPPPNIIGWGEWSAYSSCTVSCGEGQRSRLRFCSNGEGGIDQSAEGCEGDASEVISCNDGQCQSGSTLVIDIAKNLREKIDLEDNLFLDRYAQSVTENGEVINTNDSAVPGYGVWRLTEDDFAHILSISSSNFEKNFKRDNTSITTNLFSNIEHGCGKITNLIDTIDLIQLLEIVNAEPCVSAMSLVTLLEIDGNYPVPVTFEEQEQLLTEVSEQIVIDFQAGFI